MREVQQLISTQDTVRVRGEGLEQVELHARQRNLPPMAAEPCSGS
jgi:hypothetical protein